MKIYYNPNTYEPQNLLIQVRELLDDELDEFLYETHQKIDNIFTFASREDVLNCKHSGDAYFWEDGKLYECYHINKDSWQPVMNDEIVEDPGINWRSVYATTREGLIAGIRAQYNEPQGLEEHVKPTEYGLWTVSVHYSGRCA